MKLQHLLPLALLSVASASDTPGHGQPATPHHTTTHHTSSAAHNAHHTTTHHTGKVHGKTQKHTYSPSVERRLRQLVPNQRVRTGEKVLSESFGFMFEKPGAMLKKVSVHQVGGNSMKVIADTITDIIKYIINITYIIAVIIIITDITSITYIITVNIIITDITITITDITITIYNTWLLWVQVAEGTSTLTINNTWHLWVQVVEGTSTLTICVNTNIAITLPTAIVMDITTSTTKCMKRSTRVQ
ncbi:MAG: hypothetical protein SGCHY_002978 [Lobulomycetales sp.]